MDSVKQWAYGLVIMSVVSAVVLILTPSGSVEKQVRTAVSAVMLMIFIIPFFSGFDSDNETVSFSGYTYTAPTKNYNQSLVRVMSDDIENKIIKSLEIKGIKPDEVNVELIMNNENEISLQRAVIVLNTETATEESKVLKIVKEEYGIIAEVEVRD